MPEEEQFVEPLAGLQFKENENKVEICINLLQKLDRGRQGIERVYSAQMIFRKNLKNQEKLRKKQQGIEILEETERSDAIIVIQKYYRAYKVREEVWNERQ